uniref:hypothetical protein n=1 Tax=Psychrobacter sp. TaxID=56811 RepID=UPI001599B265|nr:hypothetical protein [Psychrobacter sp.]QJS05078.1 hypothetical protein [Psychrobacter sp.]
MKILIAIATLCLTSCSSITSLEAKKPNDIQGLSYYMPKKDIIVTVTMESGNVTEVELGTTPSYPDLTKRYMLKHSKNMMGKNLLNVIVTENGLLTSVRSTMTSNVTDIFKNLATTYGSFTTPAQGVGMLPSRECNSDAKHIFIYKTVGEYSPCGLSVSIEKDARESENKDILISKNLKNSYSGIFYRQEEPYRVTIKEGSTRAAINFSSIVSSPSESQTLFLPISKSFFANNDADFIFTNGVPTQYKQDVDGEALAITNIPFEIITSAFTAIGSISDRSSTNYTKEATSLENAIKLEIVKQKYGACLEAIKTKNRELVRELEC